MSRRVLFARVAAVAALVAGAAAVGLAPAYAAPATATFAKTQSWDSGYTGQFSIRNETSSAITSWKVEFDLPTGTSVGAYWDALQTNSGGRYTFTNRNYNGTVAPGAAVTFGFNASGTAVPANCKLNGAPCTGAPTLTTTTTTSTGGTTPTTTTTTSTSTTTTTPTTTTTSTPPTGLPKRVLVGYLHASFANGSGYTRMKDVSPDWDIINLSFAEPTSVTSGDLRFQQCPVAECPNVEPEAEFIAGIREKQAQGKKVLISIGGQNGQVQLTTTAARDAFVRSVGAIIDRYGLDGLDVDFEGHSLSLNAGDTDFRTPTSPVVVNLIAALKALKARYGAKFVLTMAPETFFVQLGYQFYGGGSGQDPRAGAYLPVIHAMRDDLTLLHVQHYNSGPITGLDNQYHFMGGSDFHVAMADMVLAGFPVKGDATKFFPGLRQDQVAIGLPASVNAGNGFTSVADVHKALDCLMKGTNCGPYKPKATYPNLRGLMTWSINWDKYNGYEFSRSHRAYLPR
ncbi:cellulose binding domain-containing protein [Actinosynnema sp. NPDC050436]|uniref:chitinase n=1 Tax=Actinosynnema sp. NPDC050436 TaxID=3155659 RepID=UPI0033C59A53